MSDDFDEPTSPQAPASKRASSMPPVSEKPILMSGPLVVKTMAGLKTQTRRVVKNPGRLNGLMLSGEEPEWCPFGRPSDRLWVRETWTPWLGLVHSVAYAAGWNEGQLPETCAGLTEDQQVWLERWAHKHGEFSVWNRTAKWSPAIHMPRWASRLTLEITEVRVERLQDISEEDAKSEGCEELRDDWWSYFDNKGRQSSVGVEPDEETKRELGIIAVVPPSNDVIASAKSGFRNLWDALAPKGSKWTDNPFCWVISYKLHTVNGKVVG